jgi:pimeloyl-ACP methyl ester carboxylesterase
VVPGVLGTSLDDVDAGGAEHPLWIAPLRLLETPDMQRLRMQVGATYQGDRDLDPSACVRAKDPLELVYGPLIEFLRLHGHRVTPCGYDWRRSIDDGADRLLERLTALPGPVSIVAHSMGAMVVRRCVQRAPDLVLGALPRLEDVIFIAPPFKGSFVPLQIAAQSYWLSNAFPGTRFTPAAVRETCCTFPSLAELIAVPAEFDPAGCWGDFGAPRWPLTEFSNAVLARAAAFWKDFRTASAADAALMQRSVIIFGTGRDTPVGLDLARDRPFDWLRFGDDTVPTTSAWDERARAKLEATWSHPLLPAEPGVFATIARLLDSDGRDAGPYLTPHAELPLPGEPSALVAATDVPSPLTLGPRELEPVGTSSG